MATTLPAKVSALKIRGSLKSQLALGFRCVEYVSCYTTSYADYKFTEANVIVAEEQMKSEYRGLVRTNCLLDAFAFASTEMDAKMEECRYQVCLTSAC